MIEKDKHGKESMKSNKKQPMTLATLMEKLKNSGHVPSLVLTSLRKITSKYARAMSKLFDLVKSYENKSVGISSLEKGLRNFKKQYEMAKSLQDSIFPKSLPNNNTISIEAKLVPMFDTTGDFFDVIEIVPNEVYGIMMADISGHGVSAALVTHLLKILLKTSVKKDISPSEVIGDLNKSLHGILQHRSFITGLYSLIDIPNKRYIYSSAGNIQALWYDSKRSELMKIDTNSMGMIIGINENTSYKEKEIYFSVGDRFITYTDGITEARNESKELFGDERLRELVKNNIYLPSDELIKKIETSIKEFSGKDTYDDDLTIIITDIKSEKVETHVKRDNQYKDNEIDKMVSYYKNSITINKEKNNLKGIIKNEIDIGDLYRQKGDCKRSVTFLLKAQRNAKVLHNNKLVSDTSLSIARSYLKMGDKDNCKNYLDISLKGYEELNDKKGIRDAYITKAHLFDIIIDPVKERMYLFKALKISEDFDKKEYGILADIYNSIGVSYASESEQNQALEYYEKSLEIAESEGLIDSEVKLVNNIGDIYRQQGLYEKSLEYFHRAIDVLDNFENKEFKIVIQYNIGIICYRKNDYYSANYFFNKGIKLAKKSSMPHLISLVKAYRSYIFFKEGKIRRCLKDIRDVIQINEQLKYEPLQGFIYMVTGIILSDKSISLSGEDKTMMNYIVSKLSNSLTQAEWYFVRAVEKTRDPMHTDSHIPALYEYGKYLYKNGRKVEGEHKLYEAMELAFKFKNYSEKKEIEDIITKLGVDRNLFCSNYKKRKHGEKQV